MLTVNRQNKPINCLIFKGFLLQVRDVVAGNSSGGTITRVCRNE
jgi:hypothetical protein